MRTSRILNILPFLILFIATACQHNSQKANKPMVSVSIAPQKYFIERLVDTLVDVNVLIPTGSSHATYSPTPSQLVKLSQSQAYLKIGHISFETTWYGRLKDANKNMKWYDLSENIGTIEAEHHHHDHDHTCSHETDPHIWTSPLHVKAITDNLKKTLTQLYPEYTKIIEINYQLFIKDIDDLNNRLLKLAEEKPGLSFMIFHPAYTYLAETYDFHQISIEFEGKTPSPARLQKTIDEAINNHIKTIYIQQEFDRKVAETIARSINAETVQVNPLSENWLEEMDRFITHLENS